MLGHARLIAGALLFTIFQFVVVLMQATILCRHCFLVRTLNDMCMVFDFI